MAIAEHESDCETEQASANLEPIAFRCNICNSDVTAPRNLLRRGGRESGWAEHNSCPVCGSTVRWRSIIHVLSMELFGKSLPVAEFPVRFDIKGLGLSDWDGYAVPLARHLDYRNTCYHREPKLDITCPPPEFEGAFDFVISSDVFEHVPPPVDRAFAGLHKVLKPGGLVIFSAPYDDAGPAVEHFPDLNCYEIVEINGRPLLRNTTRDGVQQEFTDLVFHGGPGATLEMRQFSKESIIAGFREAGFFDIKFHDVSCSEHGILWEENKAVPVAARLAPVGSAPRTESSDSTWAEARNVILQCAQQEENRFRIAELIAELLPDFIWPPNFERFFPFWEQYGFHVTPVHFYQPIPNTSELPATLWQSESKLPGVEMNDPAQLYLLEEVFPQFRDEYDRFPTAPTARPHEFYFENPMFSGTDALALYCMVRHFQPRRIVEVGSGFSSLVSAQALQKNGSGGLTCIEPYPSEVLQNGFPGLTKLVPTKVQEVALETFLELEDRDILFIDSSHVVQIGGDVNYLFLEVLPRLAPGVVVQVHDIFLPLHGRKDWVMEQYRFWTEQDLLQAFLAFNSEFEVLLCNSYLSRRYMPQMQETFPNSPWWGGGSFWMQRKSVARGA
jgi:SAM-dependent methyltransferase